MKPGKAQAPSDAPAPQLDAVFAGVLRGEMIAGAPRGARQRRAHEGLALAQLTQRRERFAPLRLVALV